MNKHAIYRFAVGILLYLRKNYLPNIENSIHKISKVLDEPYTEPFHEMKHVPMYVLDTKHFGLRLKPTQHT